MDIPKSLSQYLTAAQGYHQPKRYTRLLARSGSPPELAMTPLCRDVLADPQHIHRGALLEYLYRHKLHIYCYCNTDYPAVSHIKARDDILFPARNPGAALHHGACSLYHDPQPVQRDASPREAPPPLMLHKLRARELLDWFDELTLLAGRHHWIPGSGQSSARDWVQAVEGFQLAPGIPLSWYFKGRSNYLPDLVRALERHSDDWPQTIPAHGVAIITPTEIDIGERRIRQGDISITVDELIASEANIPQIGIVVVRADGTGTAAAFRPMAGQRHQIPLRDARWRPVIARLMRDLSYWHDQDRYAHSAELCIADPASCASIVVSNARGRVPVLILTGDLDDIPRKRAFEGAHAHDGFIFDAQLTGTERADQEKALNKLLFFTLIAERQAG